MEVLNALELKSELTGVFREVLEESAYFVTRRIEYDGGINPFEQ